MTDPAGLPAPAAPPRPAPWRWAVAGLALAFGLLPASGDGALAQEDTSLTVVTVDGDPASLNLVGYIASQLPDEMRRVPIEGYYDRIIDDIIDSRLAAKAARSSGLAENPQLREIADYARDRVLAGAWLQEEAVRRITDGMVEERYRAIVEGPEGQEEVRARHILLESEEAAEAAIKRLGDGEDFADLARELSTGPSGPGGGDLGYFRRGSMVPDFESATFALEKGSFSEAPVQTQFGWHVIKLEDRRPVQPPPLEAVREELVNSMGPEMVEAIVAELRGRATVDRLSLEEMQEADGKRRGGDSQ